MKVAYFSFYVIMIIINIISFIPLSIKGILGLIFIIISCMKISPKDGLITATLWVILGFINFILDINVDYKQGIIAMFLGSILYYLTVFYLGNFTYRLKNKNNELRSEIEKRKDVEKELREKLTLLQGLMNTIPSPIFLKDLKGCYMGCNHAFEVTMGIREINLIGKTTYDIADEQEADIYGKKDTELLESLISQKYEEVIKLADGSLRNIIFNKAIFTNDDKEPIGIVGVMTDITDKREAGKIKRSIDEILEYDKLKTEFFSNISHELRTPLNVILGSVQLMDLYLKDNELSGNNEKMVRNIVTMKQNCYRLLKLVNNLIDTSKIDAKSFEIYLKNCNIVSIIEEMVLSVSSYIENRGISLIFDTDIEEKIMACDQEKIERILLNLLSNAVKFTPKSGEVFVNIYNKENGICIKVEDTGIGIPENRYNQIFKRFCQVDEMFTREHEGSGIGLSLVKSLVEMHGGAITFKSKVGVGTSFMIDLPFKEVKEEERQYKMLIQQAPIDKIHIEFSDIYAIRS